MFCITPPTGHFVTAPTTLPSSQASPLQRGPFRALLSDQDPPRRRRGPRAAGNAAAVGTLASYPLFISRTFSLQRCKVAQRSRRLRCPSAKETPTRSSRQARVAPCHRPQNWSKSRPSACIVACKGRGQRWGLWLGHLPWQPLASGGEKRRGGGVVRDPSKQAKKVSGAGPRPSSGPGRIQPRLLCPQTKPPFEIWAVPTTSRLRSQRWPHRHSSTRRGLATLTVISAARSSCCSHCLNCHHSKTRLVHVSLWKRAA